MPMSFDPFNSLDRLTEDLINFRPGARFMPVDLYLDGDHYVLNADLPGIDPGSVDVDVDGQLLTIRAQRTAATQENSKWLTNERPSGTFLRQFSLGRGVEPDQISASYNNGVLSVIVPVSERAKPRKIEIARIDSEQKSLNV